MPLFSINLKGQEQAKAASLNSYPQVTGLTKNLTFVDNFEREALTPTGFPTIYTESAVNDGSTAITTTGKLNLSTGTTASSKINIRTSGLKMKRSLTNPPDEETEKLTVVVEFDEEDTNTIEGMFIGLIFDSNSALSAVPTTAKHVGIFSDDQTNIESTAGNGSAQQTQTALTTLGPTAGLYRRLTLTWNGSDNAIVKIENYLSGVQTFETSVTYTDLGTPTTATLHFYLQNIGIGGDADINIDNWSAKLE